MVEFSTFGEIMLRLSVPAGERLSDAHALDLHIGGAEANVAVGLAALGHSVHYATALPDNPLGHLTKQRLQAARINDLGIKWRLNGRIGTYYVEFATAPRAIQVVYDRADSCAAQMTAADVDWDRLLDTRLLHITGITPALSASCADLTREAVKRARSAGVPYSVDVNYRSRLWSAEQATETLTPLMHEAAVLFCKRDDARLFGITGEPAQIAEQLRARFNTGWAIVSDGANGVYGADEHGVQHEAALPVQIVDRLGAGDALAAGVLHGWLQNNDTADLAPALRYGAVMAALALSQHGDFVNTNQIEVETLVQTIGGQHPLIHR